MNNIYNKKKEFITFKNRIREADELFKELNYEEINEAGPRIKEIDDLFKEISELSPHNKKIDKLFKKINEAGSQTKNFELLKQFNIINENKKPEDLYYQLIEFLNPANNDIILSSKYGSVENFLSKKRFDEVAVECLIMERLLEFGVLADLYSHEFQNLAMYPNLIIELIQSVETEGLAMLMELYHLDDYNRNQIIAAFFNYSYCIPEITNKFANDNLEYLDSTKQTLEEFYFQLWDEKKQDRDNNYLTENKSTSKLRKKKNELYEEVYNIYRHQEMLKQDDIFLPTMYYSDCILLKQKVK